jgi:PhnB protein
MAENGLPAIVPMISYENVAEAADWLAEAFGLRETVRMTADDGSASHVELRLGDGVVMLGRPGPDYQSPKRHRESCESARKMYEVPYVIDGVHAYVDDVDAHFERAKAAGATMLSEPEDTPWGDRHYRVEDLEGHRWMFAQHVRDVAPEEWGAEQKEER